MSFLSSALDLTAKGFRVFPLLPGSKIPPSWMKGYPVRATLDTEQIVSWWTENPTCNIAISTNDLLVVDVDNKRGKNGSLTIAMLAADGYFLPDTYTQETPTTGRHMVYKAPFTCRNSVQELGQEYFGNERGFSCVDTRGYGGFIVGAGSKVGAGVYTGNQAAIASAPLWLAELFRRSLPECAADLELIEQLNIDAEAAVARAEVYLVQLPVAHDGSRNEDLYRAATWIKDLGVTPSDCLAAILQHWKHFPGMELEEIRKTVNNAFKYGTSAPGRFSAEAQFKAVAPKDAEPGPQMDAARGESLRAADGATQAAPSHGSGENGSSSGTSAVVALLNKQYAFCTIGSNSAVLWETADHKERPQLRTLTLDAFRNKIAGERLGEGDGESKEFHKIWLNHWGRRSYDALVFSPGKEVRPRFYNLWRGFAFEPTAPGEAVPATWQKALDDFLLHARQNVCNGDANLYRWLIGWFAHLIQRPWEQPLTALVMQGEKGVGKNALVDRVGALLGNHFMGTSKRRFLVGQFNSHLEDKLFFVLNEAFWAHDHAVEAVLKEITTESTNTVERKGLEPYHVDNYLRVVIMGNEDTIVPASFDERRWAVFKVGQGHKQRKEFFHNMRVWMEDGGYRLLLRYLLDYDLSGIDVREAPNTEGLHEQKLGNLDPFHTWWHECLTAGRIVSADFPLLWEEKDGKPFVADKEAMRSAFRRWRKERDVRIRDPHTNIFGKRLKECLPSVDSNQKREGQYVYVFPTLDAARAEWDKFIKFPGRW